MNIMRKTIMSLRERKVVGKKQNQLSTQRKQTPTNPRIMRKNISVNMVNTRCNKGQKTDKKLVNQKAVPVGEIGLVTPEQSIDETE